MENVLDVYQKPHDPRYPVVCMDETNKQLVADPQPPLRPKPGQVVRQDYEYERNGVSNLFTCFEPLRNWQHVEVTDQRTAVDWAHFMQQIADVHYPDAERILVVLDNLNTHGPGSFYEAFVPDEAKRLVARFEFHYTPKHGSWLNMAEIELSALSRTCLDRRIPDKCMLTQEAATWESERNVKSVTVEWRFTTDQARVKLKKLYPIISM